MPNHVTTICTVTGPAADVAAFVEKHIVPVPEKGVGVRFFDFGTIIPKPASVSETSSGSKQEVGFFALTGRGAKDASQRWMKKFPALANIDSEVPCRRFPYLPPEITTREKLLAYLVANDPEALVEGAKSLKCLKETGEPDWSEWSLSKWGTKWGAYDYEERERGDGRFVFKFETAWSFPEPIFRKLATMYPAVVFAVVSHDEGDCFGCEGEFNGRDDYRCAKELGNDEMYVRVHGQKREHDEE